MNTLFFARWRKTFTLIEVLIVVVVIGILAVALVPRYQSMQERSRDSKRKADLLQIAQWLANQYADNGKYGMPHSQYDCGTIIPGGTFACTANSDTNIRRNSTWLGIRGLVPQYMTALPVDPVNNRGTLSLWSVYGNTESSDSLMYSYQIFSWAWGLASVIWDDGFSLTARLENKKDTDRCEIKKYYIVWTNGATANICLAFQNHLYVLNDPKH